MRNDTVPVENYPLKSIKPAGIRCMGQAAQIGLLGLSLQELTLLAEEAGQPGFRGRQLFEALYRQRVESAEQVSTMPLEFRRALAQNGVSVGLPVIEKRFVSSDGTVRYLMNFVDGQSVETVWMPEGDGGERGDGSEAERGWDRATICVSSQVGCAVDCQFCLTALLGVKRNLTAGEIVGQVCAVLNDQHVSPPQDRVNLVFMGMGEPFLNYDNFMKSVRLLVEGVGIPESRMTVSTAGIVPRIYDFGTEPVRPKLAISLNASNDELRTRLMPINRKWNLEKLMAAARDFPLRNRERLTFEYRSEERRVGKEWRYWRDWSSDVCSSDLVSTAGIVPRIYDFGTEPVRPKLAISLNASNVELRTRLMPINRKWNLEKLMAAARDFPLRNRERLTFEYVLLDAVNDFAKNACNVLELISRI